MTKNKFDPEFEKALTRIKFEKALLVGLWIYAGLSMLGLGVIESLKMKNIQRQFIEEQARINSHVTERGRQDAQKRWEKTAARESAFIKTLSSRLSSGPKF